MFQVKELEKQSLRELDFYYQFLLYLFPLFLQHQLRKMRLILTK